MYVHCAPPVTTPKMQNQPDGWIKDVLEIYHGIYVSVFHCLHPPGEPEYIMSSGIRHIKTNTSCFTHRNNNRNNGDKMNISLVVPPINLNVTPQFLLC